MIEKYSNLRWIIYWSGQSLHMTQFYLSKSFSTHANTDETDHFHYTHKWNTQMMVQLVFSGKIKIYPNSTEWYSMHLVTTFIENIACPASVRYLITHFFVVVDFLTQRWMSRWNEVCKHSHINFSQMKEFHQHLYRNVRVTLSSDPFIRSTNNSQDSNPVFS